MRRLERSSSARWRVGLGVAVVLGAACSRTPPEPAQASATPLAASSAPPATVVAVPSVAPASTGTARCLRATPDAPPPVAPPAAKGTCPKDPGPAPASLPVVHVLFPGAAPPSDAAAAAGAVQVSAELARAPHETERGLMYRQKMPEDRGMLFDLGDRREHVFWMRNTCLPLDMLFVDDDGTIVGVLENVPTLNDEERTVGCPSSWVLEVNAGWSRRHGVRAGQRMTLPSR